MTDQVPETKTYLFIKLPDRILLIDPDFPGSNRDSKVIAFIIGIGGLDPLHPGYPR